MPTAGEDTRLNQPSHILGSTEGLYPITIHPTGRNTYTRDTLTQPLKRTGTRMTITMESVLMGLETIQMAVKEKAYSDMVDAHQRAREHKETTD